MPSPSSQPGARGHQPYPTGGPGRPLHIGSHNVGGRLISDRNHARASADLWRRERLDVIALQETFVDDSNCALASKWLLDLGFTSFWNIKRLINSDGTRARRNGGTAFVIRSSLLRGENDADLQCSNLFFSDDGRLTSARIRWGDHSFTCLSLYLPSANAAAQKQFISRHLHSSDNMERKYSREKHLWFGDFNFICDPGRDCFSSSNLATPRQADVGVSSHWNSSSCKHMADVFRNSHPNKKQYTYFSHHGGARLDRIYASTKILGFISHSNILSFTTSDHRLVKMDLLPNKAPQSGQPGQRVERRLKIGIDFIDNRDTKATFEAWLRTWMASAPEPAADIVTWFDSAWPKLQSKIQSLNAVARRTALQAARAYAPGETVKNLMERIDRGEEVNLEQLIGAQKAHSAALVLDASQQFLQSRMSWVHSKECPSIALTRALNNLNPKGPDVIPAVRLPDGRLTSDPIEMATAAINFTASISAPRPPEQHNAAAAASAKVEAAMFECGHSRIDSTSDIFKALDVAGSAVTEGEVAHALKKCKRRTSAGPDGIRPEVFTSFAPEFSPFFAKIFSAILSSKSAPKGFMDGIVIYIYKRSGERCSIGNYRPITLLNTVYRLLAKTLAHILNPRMSDIIDDEQKGFLVGRQIGEVVITIQAAQALLESRGEFACLIFADFMKAYDTVDRSFLLRIMAFTGVPKSFCEVVFMLLSNTRACASVNGILSPWVDFLAGVRQGCPLAPLLYLFVAEALHCVLGTTSGVGMECPIFDSSVTVPKSPVDGPSVVVMAPQYADDITPLVRGGSAAAVDPQILLTGLHNARTAFDIFGQASGQCLNAAKTHLLPIGRLPNETKFDLSSGANLAGFTVVASATTLGITFERGGGGHTTISRGRPLQVTAWTAQEESRLEGVEGALKALGRMKLSLLGRGLGSGAYCTSKFFYHLEFRLPIPPNKFGRLNSAIASLMSDKHRGGRRPFYAIAQEVAAGRLKHGGLGSFPWNYHIASRHARWASRLLAAPLSVAWASLLRALLFDLCGPRAHPIILFDLSPALRDSAPALRELPAALGVDNTTGPWNAVPNVLARLAIGARSLGSVALLAGVPSLPIKGGGLELAAPLPADWSPTSLMSTQHLSGISSILHTVGFIISEKSAMSILPSVELPTPPDDGRIAAPARGGEPERRPKKPSGPSALTVGGGTQMQITRHCDPRRQQKLAKFCKVATGLHCDGESAGNVDFVPPDPSPEEIRALKAELKSIRGIFKRVWSLSWSNQRKEIFWRLVYHGIPTSVRLGQRQRRCPCGTMPQAPAGRPHVFWSCPVAVAIREHILAALGHPPHGLPHLLREHIWLFRPPQPGINQLFWDVICLAALGAMEYGRRVLLSLSLQNVDVQGGGASQNIFSSASDEASVSSSELVVEGGRDFVTRARRAAVAHFYAGLADFCSVTFTLELSLVFSSTEARDRHPLLRIRPPPANRNTNLVVGSGPAPMDPLSGSVYAVVVPRSVSLPRHDACERWRLIVLLQGLQQMKS